MFCIKPSDTGLLPFMNMAFSAKTLFNGDNLGLQTYSVVRVCDYITKVDVYKRQEWNP